MRHLSTILAVSLVAAFMPVAASGQVRPLADAHLINGPKADPKAVRIFDLPPQQKADHCALDFWTLVRDPDSKKLHRVYCLDNKVVEYRDEDACEIIGNRIDFFRATLTGFNGLLDLSRFHDEYKSNLESLRKLTKIFCPGMTS